MHMSNFRPVKRAGMVLDVFERIRRRMPAKLVFIGDGPDRAATEAARARVDRLPPTCIFEGEQQDPVPLLSCADLFLLPSSQESFGMAALEAMACEVPVIASRIGGLPELIDDGADGIPVRRWTMSTAWRHARLRSCRTTMLARTIGKAAAASVSKRFCVDESCRCTSSTTRKCRWICDLMAI